MAKDNNSNGNALEAGEVEEFQSWPTEDLRSLLEVLSARGFTKGGIERHTRERLSESQIARKVATIECLRDVIAGR